MDVDSEYLRLLSATAQGDRTAFAELYTRSSGKLFAIGVQMLRRRDWAEDALQETYVRIWHRAADYQVEKGSVLTWMISILRYRALDMLRAAKVRGENARANSAPAANEADFNDEPADEPNPEDQLFQARDKVRIDKCMGLLEGQQRQAIHLAYFGGLTHFEICDHMVLPLGTIKTWIRRGLARLKRCLES